MLYQVIKAFNFFLYVSASFLVPHSNPVGGGNAPGLTTAVNTKEEEEETAEGK